MEKYLIFILFLIITTLLIAGRFGFEWAGGEGYEKPLTATLKEISGTVTVGNGEKETIAIEENKINRGEQIKTSDNSLAIILIGERIKIFLDQRTDVIVEKNFPSVVEIKLVRGRLLADTSSETEKLIISTSRSTNIITAGKITAVRYDFLDKTSVMPIDTSVEITVANLSKETTKPVEISEIEPFTISSTDFSLTAPEVIDFYEWANKF